MLQAFFLFKSIFFVTTQQQIKVGRKNEKCQMPKIQLAIGTFTSKLFLVSLALNIFYPNCQFCE